MSRTTQGRCGRLAERKGAKLSWRAHCVRLLKALRYSVQGLRVAWSREVSFRLEVWASGLVVPLAMLLGESGVEKALLALSWLLVPLAELFNSALEHVVDLSHPEPHPLAGQAKDLGSAAVLLAFLVSGLSWALILLF